MKIFKTIFTLLSFSIFFLILPMFLAIHYSVGIAGIGLVGIILVFLLTYFIHNKDEILSIGFWTLKIELREKIREADKIIGRIRLLAKILSEVTLCLLSVHKRSCSQITFPAVCEYIDNIENMLIEIGISNKEIEQIKEVWNDTIMTRYINLLIGNMEQQDADSGVKEKIEKLRNFDTPPHPKDVRNLLNSIGTLDEGKKQVLEKVLEDYAYFYEHKKVKSFQFMRG